MNVIRQNYSQLSLNEKKIIDQFIENNDGLIFHEIDFNEIVSETFNTSLCYALAYEKNILVGICPIHTIQRGFLKQSFSNPSQFEVPYGGWVFVKEQSHHQLIDGLHMAFNESISYWTSLFSSNTEVSLYQHTHKKYATALVELAKTEQEIWQGQIHSKRRNMVRKAEKSSIRIEQFGFDNLDIWYSLLLDMNMKTGIHSQIKIFYEKILKRYHPSKCVILLALLGDEVIAGNMLIGNRNVIHYWQGASKFGVGNYGQGELLQWEGIRWAKSLRSQYYDMCVIEQERLPYIAQFKMGFSKELVPFYCIVKKSFTFRLLNKLQTLIK